MHNQISFPNQNTKLSKRGFVLGVEEEDGGGGCMKGNKKKKERKEKRKNKSEKEERGTLEESKTTRP